VLNQLRAKSDWNDKNVLEKGFTLVELLVVIVILGILAAVVVFAVGGLGDKGKEEACRTDLATLRTAEEAHFSQHDTYASEADLKTKNFIVDVSPHYNISGVSASGYTLDVQDTDCPAP